MENFEDRLRSFRAEAEENTALANKIKDQAVEYRHYLEGRGVDSDDPTVLIELVSITAHKVIIDELLPTYEHPPQEILDIKKRVQARYYLEKRHPAWLEVADMALPGPPLDMHDTDTITAVFTEILESKEKTEAQFIARKDEMTNFINNARGGELNQLEKDLIVILACTTQENFSQQNAFEIARDYILAYDLYEEPAWWALLNHFFPTVD